MMISSSLDVPGSAELLFVKDLAAAFKALLETKHLYQTLHVSESSDGLSALLTRVPPGQQDLARRTYAECLSKAWQVAAAQPMPSPGRSSARVIVLPIIKLHCRACGRLEPYSCRTLEALHSSGETASSSRNVVQVWAITFECRSCQSEPQAFLVSRVSLKLCIAGRYPIEEVVLPSYIPKADRKHFSDAIVAYNSGFTLAALFYLRVFVEQHANRAVAPAELQGDALLDAYAETVPLGVRQAFPSLREVYGQLSAAIHRATASDVLFLSMKEKIEAHLEAVQLFRNRAAT